MSANDAKPTGEVKNPDEPYFGDEGVNYDAYADDSSIGGPEKADINFDSRELEHRQKQEFFVNIKGAEKLKREEERREAEMSKRRLKELKRLNSEEKRGTINKNASTSDLNDLKKIVRGRKMESARQNIGHFFSKNKRTIVIAVLVAVLVAVAIFVATLVINAGNKEIIKKENTTSSKSVADLFTEVQGLMVDDSKNYEKCKSLLEDRLKSSTTDSEKVLISVYYSEFIYEHTTDFDESLRILDDASKYMTDRVDDGAKAQYYNAYISLYGPGGEYDEAKFKHYTELLNQIIEPEEMEE